MKIRLRESKLYSYNDVFSKQEIDSYYLNSIGKEDSKFIKEKIDIKKLRELNGLDLDEDTDEIEQTISYFEENGLDEDYNISKELLNKIYDGINLNPIVVNENYRILDGWHRLATYSELYFYSNSFNGIIDIFKRVKK